MKKILSCLLLVLMVVHAPAQSNTQSDTNTLLWRITGKDLQKPSYLFGTIHMICSDKVSLSDSLRSAIGSVEQVYLELDMDNVLELMGVVNKMKMNGDTTLADLLTSEEYQAVKAFFSRHDAMIPFAMLEKYKPMLAASSLMQSDMACNKPISMEQLIMKESRIKRKRINGLETMAYQLSIFDSIPYKAQAKQLYAYVQNYGKKDERKQYEELINAYLTQRLDKLGELTLRDDAGLQNFTDLLLFRRNENWVKKLGPILFDGPVVVAVGAGHLPGPKGMIALLRKAGYTLEPVPNNMLKKMEKEL